MDDQNNTISQGQNTGILTFTNLPDFHKVSLSHDIGKYIALYRWYNNVFNTSQSLALINKRYVNLIEFSGCTELS